ncbi:RNA polymerase sigma factor [Thalassospira xiamenensis]|uniref:RNA polymerase sigma-70 factor, ECF subfamily n=1 Tax=Thalassospira xiamenensis TaxID=220697 RepID=A0A285TNG0_9PROT|nr:RNA polymerase sigma factor [Thalassospira xiamenensis]SOC23688.1 RNA polymerase sigma-70 factor, ECF subfamily [Thalassospira xiamenensis]
MTKATDATDIKWRISREIPHLRRFARSLVSDRDRADDLVQDCLERAIRKHHLWRRTGSVRSWLFKILYNVFVNQYRKKMAEIPMDDAVPELSVPARQEKRMICMDIGQALEKLPPNQKAVILLIALEGVTYDEAAEVLDISVGTVRSRLSRGRDSLRSLYSGKTNVKLRRVK